MAVELVVSYEGEEQVLTVEDRDVITLPEGLVGFGEWRRFVLIEDPTERPLGVFQCMDDTDVSFLVTDPWHVYPDYDLRLAPEVMRELGLAKVEDVRALCLLAARDRPVVVTANLLAPVVINPETRLARQVILQDSSYSAQYPVMTAEAIGAEPCSS